MTLPGSRTARRISSLLVVPVATLALAAPAAADTWYVKADRSLPRSPGEGTREEPFTELETAEHRSGPGDRIVVLPSPLDVNPLIAGIALKPRQTLLGAGPSVTDAEGLRRLPQIRTFATIRNHGDAVTLADHATVRNLVIRGAARSGIYGRNVTGVGVLGNDVSRHNRSCRPGFHIPPFLAPTTVPGVAIPIPDGLHNGRAAIMVDADRGTGTVTIAGNEVHASDCGDGIDVRLFGTAAYRAQMTGNEVHDLRQGEEFESLLAIGLQTSNRSRLTARLDRNTQTDLGNPEDPGIGPLGADTEGVFANLDGRSRMDVTVTRNTYTNPRGLGGFSANGMEYVNMGHGTRSRMVIRDSTFSGTPGDILEQGNLGTDSHMSLKLRGVTATRSGGFANTGYGNTVLVPFNNGDCLLVGSGGAGSTLKTTIRDSRLSGCANNGISVGANVVDGEGPMTRIAVDVARSVIARNHGANLGVRNFTPLTELEIRVEDTDLRGARGTGSGIANIEFEDLATTTNAAIDLGGGPLGSQGRNCIAGATFLDAEVLRYDVSARHNWWGRPGGPLPVRTIAVGGRLDTTPALAAPPPAC